MKFDMHCHTAKGSLDSKVPIEEYIDILRKKGFDGMLVTDHDSYRGYRYWLKNIAGKSYRSFVVLKGIEYDTIDAGHMLIIMPDTANVRLLEFRGLPVRILIDVVHAHGGIIGPAHPYGERYLSFAKTYPERRKIGVIKQFDFIETYNACEDEEANRRALALARRFNKPCFGGSDAHKPDCCGLGFTQISGEIRTQADLIAAVKDRSISISAGGTRYGKTTKDKLGSANDILVRGFKYYNRFAGLIRARKRRNELKREEELAKIKEFLKL